ncbi:GNAT family N-acetyltransferase [Gemmobacter sp. 24YEA27]|uniref:GNAT family N-acetyltransferase n=1 Tax=Gemmobacter sp. 24YEA27 TaxID=3040672 RepID=UPI0024B3571C|nr:GNAT family N-acetyltransferase [Gemmobacter sp. 24YEA27]
MQWQAVKLRTERLRIKPFSPDDADEAFIELTPSLTRFMSFDPPPSRAAFETVWKAWLKTIEDGSDLTFVLRLRDTRRFIGLAGLHNTGSAEPELGIWVAEREHGNGYGREAVHGVARWGATAFGAIAFRYPVAVANSPSRRLAEALGGLEIGNETAPKYESVIYRIPSVGL